MPSKPPLKVLSIDTSTLRESVSLLLGMEVVAELRSFSTENHSARLLKSVDLLLNQAAWKIGDIQLVTAGLGPGSFTGIRIGVSTALGLAQTLGCAFSGISGLDALANEIRYMSGRIGVVMDAQRGQVYFGEYGAGRRCIRRVGRPVLLFPEELRNRLGARRIYLAGDGAKRYAKDLKVSGLSRRQYISVDWFLAAGIGRLAQQRKRSWQRGEYVRAEPLYIRPPYAGRQRLEVR